MKKLRKEMSLLIAVLLMLQTGAFAEIYSGSTVAGSVQSIVSEAGGLLESLDATLGQRLTAGEKIGETRANRVFATENGTVATLQGEVGKAMDGTVLEIAPENRYVIYCTVEKAYQEAENTLVHAGERLMMRCTANGTHRAIGIVNEIDGEEYRVEAIGGELYIGETVYLYRGEDFESEQRVGIGTVVGAENQSYAIDGTLLNVCVQAGERVEKGELLFTWAEALETAIVADTDGVISELCVAEGETLRPDQTVAMLVPIEDILVEIKVDETEISGIAIGDSACFICASDDEETNRSGEVIEILDDSSGNGYRVRIQPEQPVACLGMSVEVAFEE